MKKNEMCMIQARVNSETKKQAEEILDELGLSVTEAVKIFLKQVVLRGAIPFEIKIPEIAEDTIISVRDKKGNCKLVKVENLK